MNVSAQNGTGYPPRFYSERRLGWLGACIPLLFLGVCAALFGWLLVSGNGGVLQALGFVWVVWMIRGLIKGILLSWREASIYPYYDQRLPDADTFLSGQAILKNCLHLDRLAESNGVKSISAFGFPDALSGQKVIWHDAAEGLNTIECLIHVVTENPDSVEDSTGVLSDLGKIKNAFERAETDGIKFSFLLESNAGTNGIVWEIRGGFP